MLADLAAEYPNHAPVYMRVFRDDPNSPVLPVCITCSIEQNRYVSEQVVWMYWGRGNCKARVDGCDKCNYDTHQCPGCGEPLAHLDTECWTCRREL